MAGRGSRAGILALVVACLVAPRASAQPGESFEALLKKLDAPELSVRESATTQLAQGERFTLPVIEKALTDQNLSPEQRQRLRWVGQQLFARSPRAAMGISFIDWEDSGAVVEPVPGFDSERVLRSGDLLGTIDGQRVTNQLDVRQIIISHDPGDEVSLGIIRSGTPMTVTLKMGRLADLPNMGDRRTPATSSLSGAWSYRLARLGEPRPAAVECALGADQWREIAERAALTDGGRQEPMHDPFTGEPVRSVMNRPPTSALSVGGQTRYPSENTGAAMARSGPVVVPRAGRGGNVFVRDGNVVFRDQGVFDRAEREQLRTQREQWINVIAGNNARINDPTLAEPERSKLKMDNDAAAAALQAIEARLQQLSRVPEVRP